MMFGVLTQEMEKEVEDHRIELDIVQRRRERELQSPGGFLLLSYERNILSPFLERTIFYKSSQFFLNKKAIFRECSSARCLPVKSHCSEA